MTVVEAYRRGDEEGIPHPHRGGDADGALAERNEMVIAELPQVYYIAARIRERLPQHVEMEDLVHAGVLGLIEAWKNFDETKTAGFSTFAKFRIRGAILDSLRKLDWGSRGLRRKGRAITASIAALAGTLGRQPTQEEIAKDLEMELDELQSTMTQLDGLYLVGQQTELKNDGGAVQDLIESAPSRGGDDPLALCLAGEAREHLKDALKDLSDREQLILSLYYTEELTMREIAEVIGVAVSRISQLHAAALAKLRGSLQHLRQVPEQLSTAHCLPRESRPVSVQPQWRMTA